MFNHHCSGPTRRSFLQLGSLGIGGLTLPNLLRSRALAGEPAVAPDTSVILIWCQGGPSHIDMYDMKPDAPTTHRSPFAQIPTNVSGLDICEHMPMQAKVADKFSIIRSIAHKHAGHPAGSTRFLSGYDPPIPNERVGAYPEFGSVIAKVRERVDRGVPNYISSAKQLSGGGPAYLGKSATPFVVDGDPNDDKFEVKNIAPPAALANSLDDRVRLLKELDTFRRDLDQSGSMGALDEFNQRALNLLTSQKVREAFDISKEPDSVRDMYGRHKWGQRALLARRLVEAGSSFVTMQIQRSGFGKSGNWDDHAVNWHIFDELKLRLPVYDRAVAALVSDIYQRGLDKKVLVIVTGEFGRTPKINNSRGVGRGHWSRAMSVLVSGGGLRHGQVIGATNDKAEEPKDRPLSPNDLLATVYRHMGIDTHHAFEDKAGRPIRILSDGEPISELG